MLSKETRSRVIKALVDVVGDQEMAASILGVSRTAVYKFVNDVIHPSDTVTLRALDYLKSRGGYDWQIVASRIARELKAALEEFAEYAGARVECKAYNTILAGVIG